MAKDTVQNDMEIRPRYRVPVAYILPKNLLCAEKEMLAVGSEGDRRNRRSKAKQRFIQKTQIHKKCVAGECQYLSRRFLRLLLLVTITHNALLQCKFVRDVVIRIRFVFVLHEHSREELIGQYVRPVCGDPRLHGGLIKRFLQISLA